MFRKTPSLDLKGREQKRSFCLGKYLRQADVFGVKFCYAMGAKVTEYCVNIRDKILTFEDVSLDDGSGKYARSSKESSGLEKENSMNALWLSNIEILAEEERADFRREMEKYRLGREALSTKPRKPSWIVRRMQDLSVWMVTTGERLHRRYYDTDPIPRWYQSFKVAR